MIMHGTTAMNIGACVGLKETLAVNRLNNSDDAHYPLNQYIGKNFFDGENYRAALERLDEGKALFHVIDFLSQLFFLVTSILYFILTL